MNKSINQEEFVRYARNPENSHALLNRVTGLVAGGYFDTPDEVLDFVKSAKITGKNEAYLRVAQATGIKPNCPKQQQRAKEVGISFEFNQEQENIFHETWEKKISKEKLKSERLRTSREAQAKQSNYLQALCPVEARTFTD